MEPQSAESDFTFRPGQFNMLYAFGVGDVPISISGDTAPGDALGVRGPFGTSWPSEELLRKDVVVVTGGIGLTPLRPIIYEISAHRSNYHNVNLLYGGRTPHDLLYTDELETWRVHDDIDAQVTVDAAGEGWQGKVPVSGVVMDLLDSGVEIHCMRDLTRGGLASTLVEIAETAKVHIALKESAVPVDESVRGACELLGLDPLHIANEGRFIAFVPPNCVDLALKIMHSHASGANACQVGRVTAANDGLVTMQSLIGVERIVDMLSGEQLPWIC